jgi:hypothetical protein
VSAQLPKCAVCGLIIFNAPILLQGEPLHVGQCFALGLQRLRTVLRPIVDVDCTDLHPQQAFEAGRALERSKEPAR